MRFGVGSIWFWPRVSLPSLCIGSNFRCSIICRAPNRSICAGRNCMSISRLCWIQYFRLWCSIPNGTRFFTSHEWTWVQWSWFRAVVWKFFFRLPRKELLDRSFELTLLCLRPLVRRRESRSVRNTVSWSRVLYPVWPWGIYAIPFSVDRPVWGSVGDRVSKIRFGVQVWWACFRLGLDRINVGSHGGPALALGCCKQLDLAFGSRRRVR